MLVTKLNKRADFAVCYNSFRNRFDAVGDAGCVLASVPCDGRISASRPARTWLAEQIARDNASNPRGPSDRHREGNPCHHAHGTRILRPGPVDQG